MSRFLECQKSHIAIDIIKYNVVHTGPNTQSGGLNIGLFNNEYQGFIKLIVAKPPIKEAEKVMRRNSINVNNLFLIMLIIHNKK